MYTATGCEDPVLPVGVAFSRQGNKRGVITCSDESLVHQYVVCENSRWVGDIPDCSRDVIDASSHGKVAAYTDKVVITTLLGSLVAWFS